MSEEAMTEAVSEALSVMRLTLANPPTFSGELVRIWALVLARAGLTPDEVRRGAEIVITIERFFPQPAVFIEAVKPRLNDDLLAEAAWQRVRDCLVKHGANASLTASDLNGDTAALWATDRLGWERMGNEMGEENRAIFRAEFVRCYRLAKQERTGLEYLPGRLERQNGGANVTLTPALVGRPDWSELPAARQLNGSPQSFPGGPDLPALPEF